MRNLLIIIDLQQGWRHKTATEAAMLRGVELCKHFDGDVIHCCFKNDPASLFQTQLHWKRFIESPDIDEIPEIAPLKLPRYWRSTYSCVNDETWPIIEPYDHVYIAGVFTDISVTATAMHIFDKNKAVSVVADCVATLHGQAIHEAALRSLEHAIGRRHVIPTATVPQR
ncbi:MAG TPA: isochorismatase family protein [Candidatus Saccharimonadales bacterium]|nr:isochorismatase family protein [Candidatus Saccharimonadales bacterium]